jgi:23S rRNA (uracil1939-C5)-methyltransferase
MSFAVEIEKLVYGGRGLARADGRVVLAPFVMPGERVLVEVEKETADLISARNVGVEAASAERVEAPCPYFARCGGCHYQHIPYERQLAFKRDILLETLARLGKVTWAGDVELVSGEPWGYRNRVQLHFHRVGARIATGYHEHGSRRLCPVEKCPIASPAINRAIAALGKMGHDRWFPEFMQGVELFTNESEIQLTVTDSLQPVNRRFFEWCSREIEGFSSRRFLEYAVGDTSYRVGERSFFQVNRFLVARLAELAVAEHAGDAGGTAIDLFAGVGLFTLPLARRFSRVVALDSSRSAAADLEFNAGRAGVPVEAHHGSAEEFLETWQEPVDLVLADPPRAGLGRAVTAALVRLRPRRLTVVSCDPATLARDLRALIEGGFQIAAVKLVDLFPQTFHIESLIELTSS